MLRTTDLYSLWYGMWKYYSLREKTEVREESNLLEVIHVKGGRGQMLAQGSMAQSLHAFHCRQPLPPDTHHTFQISLWLVLSRQTKTDLAVSTPAAGLTTLTVQNNLTWWGCLSSLPGFSQPRPMTLLWWLGKKRVQEGDQVDFISGSSTAR